MRLIDADVLKQHIDKLPALPDGNFAGNHSALKALINMQPTIEERKTGKWICNSPVTMKCNQCGLIIKDWDWHRFKYCPNCCADMRGEQDEMC